MFKYLCMSCGTVENESQTNNGYCVCGADNFIEYGDSVIIPNGNVRSVVSIHVDSTVTLLGESRLYNFDEIVYCGDGINGGDND